MTSSLYYTECGKKIILILEINKKKKKKYTNYPKCIFTRSMYNVPTIIQ